jgi:hypothetical protein
VRAAEPGESQKLENAPVGVLPEVMTGVDQAAQHTLLVRVGHREVQQLETPSRREDASMSGAVISHELWQRRFGGAHDALGPTITAGEHAWTVVGVMPPRFDVPIAPADV